MSTHLKKNNLDIVNQTLQAIADLYIWHQAQNLICNSTTIKTANSLLVCILQNWILGDIQVLHYKIQSTYESNKKSIYFNIEQENSWLLRDFSNKMKGKKYNIRLVLFSHCKLLKLLKPSSNWQIKVWNKLGIGISGTFNCKDPTLRGRHKTMKNFDSKRRYF